MPIVVGVTLRTAGKLYFFDPGEEQFQREELVLVETARGPELGIVKLPPHEVDQRQIVPPLKPVIRRATAADHSHEAINRERETQALQACKELVAKLNLPMTLIDAQYTFDSSHLLIHFLADSRVDFRELVRELAHKLHTRIELRQVGVRDQAKLLGGHGVCGRPLCCSTFLTNFAPVAINLAKTQGLALNPQKISGMCGRLMCCLAFEQECYSKVIAELPRVNSTVQTPRGEGKVTKLNVLARQIEVLLPDATAPVWFTVEELNFEKSGGHTCCRQAALEQITEEELPDTDDFPVVTNDEVPTTPGETSSSDEPHSRRRRRGGRRRGKKPVEAGGRPTFGAETETNEQSTPQPDNNGETSPRPKRRRRSRKPRPAGAEPAPVPVGVAAGPSEATEGSQPRRRPRRRR